MRSEEGKTQNKNIYLNIWRLFMLFTVQVNWYPDLKACYSRNLACSIHIFASWVTQLQLHNFSSRYLILEANINWCWISTVRWHVYQARALLPTLYRLLLLALNWFLLDCFGSAMCLNNWEQLRTFKAICVMDWMDWIGYIPDHYYS